MSMCNNLGVLALGIRCLGCRLIWRETRISQNLRKTEIFPNLANDLFISYKLS